MFCPPADDDADAPIRVENCAIACGEPAVAERRAGEVKTTEIAGEQPGAADMEIAFGACFDSVAGVVDDLDRAGRDRFTVRFVISSAQAGPS
jgi:hypothetical protein